MEVEDFLDLLVFEDMLNELIETEAEIISKKLGLRKLIQKDLLLDVINEKNFIRVTVEMPPGVCKNDIKIFSTFQTLEVIVNGEVLASVNLPELVEKTGRATFKNGFLEVLLKKAEKFGIKLD